MADEKPADAAPEAPAAEPTEATAAGAPKLGAIRTLGSSTRRANSSPERSNSEEAAPAEGKDPARSADGSTPAEAAATASPPSAAKSASGGSTTPADTDAAAPPTKPDAGRRALTIAMEKEAQLVESQRALKAEREAWTKERDQAAADLKLIAEAREAIKGGKRLRALELLGIGLDDVQDEYLANVREPTTEDIVAKAVAERLESEQRRLADEAAARAKAEEETRTADFNARVTTWKTAAEKLYVEKAESYDPAAFDGITADQIWERAVKEHGTTGKLPTTAETLDLIQRDFDARLAKSKKFKPVEATKPAEGESQETSARAKTPRVLTSKDAGSVPLKPKRVERPKNAFERLEEAKRDLGVD